jgi:hypothetical protein
VRLPAISARRWMTRSSSSSFVTVENSHHGEELNKLYLEWVVFANQFDALSTNQVKEPTSTTIPEMRQCFDIAVVLDGPEPMPI